MAAPAESKDPDKEEYSEDEDDPNYKKFLSKYKLLSTIGTGGFSVVKKATRLKTKDTVAVKIISSSFTQSQITEREIHIMKKAASHPNILQLYDVFTTKKNVFLVMELAEGGEVFDQIVNNGEYSEHDGSVVLRQIVDAVRYLHNQGIAHRDIKPQNLLCTSKGATDVRIADFGLSKIFSGNTMMKTCCGSPEYVAPEILKGETYDNSVDMWSIGVVCYILLTGCFPFWSNNVSALYRKIMAGVYIWPTKPVVSEAAKDLVRRLLEKDSSKRLTAEECLRHPWITGQGAATTASIRTWKDIQDRRIQVRQQNKEQMEKHRSNSKKELKEKEKDKEKEKEKDATQSK